jgi:hypothetical protein
MTVREERQKLGHLLGDCFSGPGERLVVGIRMVEWEKEIDERMDFGG